MERLLAVLKDVRDDVDFENCTTLIDDEVLDSFDIIQIINGISDEYDIEIPANKIVPDNFNSAEALLKMINEIAE